MQERYEVFLLRSRQPGAEDEVEELDGVFQSQQPAVVEIGRRILHAAEGERLDWAVADGGEAHVRLRRVETLGPQVVHRVVSVVRGRMALAAQRLAEEQRLPAELRLAGLLRIELAQHVQLRRRREVEQRLEFGHVMHLSAAVQWTDALLGRRDRVAIEISRPLLELGEILD